MDDKTKSKLLKAELYNKFKSLCENLNEEQLEIFAEMKEVTLILDMIENLSDEQKETLFIVLDGIREEDE